MLALTVRRHRPSAIRPARWTPARVSPPAAQFAGPTFRKPILWSKPIALPSGCFKRSIASGPDHNKLTRKMSEKPLTIDDVFAECKPAIDKAVADHLPRAFDQDSFRRLCGPPRYAYDTESATKALTEPMWDILDRGGKRWRPVLVMLVAGALGGKFEDLAGCAYLCEIVHNGTLAVDDIEDDSKLRRGKPCLHLTYGVDVAINAGNAMYFFPLVVFKDLKEKGVPDAKIVRAYELYSEEMIKLHFGQGLDIWWHKGNGNKNPTAEEYLQMCAYKTGTLARLSAKLAALVANGTDAQIEGFGRFAEAIGVAFQIQDDLLNIAGDKFAEKIAMLGEDIHEGKRTIMVIHSLKHASAEKAKRLQDILNLHTNDQALINEAIQIMVETKSLDYAREVAKKIVRDAWAELDAALPASVAKTKLKLFADYLVDRDCAFHAI